MNYENTAFYSIQVSVDDGIYKTEINLAITVDNVNEWTPSFVKSGKFNFVTILILPEPKADVCVFLIKTCLLYTGFDPQCKSLLEKSDLILPECSINLLVY